MSTPRTARSKKRSRAAAADAIARAQRRGEKVVFTSGCFDLLHLGHIRSLEEARGYGDRLVVALNTDASVRRMKGSERPVIPLRQRAELVAALECVDWVISFGEPTPRAAIRALGPDVYCKGGDWPLDDHRGLANEVRVLGFRPHRCAAAPDSQGCERAHPDRAL